MTFNFLSKTVALAAAILITSTSVYAKENGDTSDSEVSIMSSAAREIHKHGIGLGVGQTFLLGSFEDQGDNKIAFPDLFYSYTASYSFDLLVNLHSSHHEYRDEEVWLRGLAFGVKARPYEFDAFSPFILGGLGFYIPQIAKNGEKSDEKTTFGLNLGAGVDLRLNRNVVVGILGQFHNPFNVKQDETEDVKGSYFKLLLTAMYLF